MYKCTDVHMWVFIIIAEDPPPDDFTLSLSGNDSIIVSWTPESVHNGSIYTIFHSNFSENVSVSGLSLNHTLKELTFGERYEIFMVAQSDRFDLKSRTIGPKNITTGTQVSYY